MVSYIQKITQELEVYLKLIGDDINDPDLIEKDPDQDDQDHIMENISSAHETNQQQQQLQQLQQQPQQPQQIEVIDKSTKSNANIDNDDENDETDLTNLAWLTDLKNLTNLPDIIVGGHGGKGGGGTGSHGGTGADEEIIEPISDKNLTEIRFNNFMTQVKQNQQLYAKQEELYRTNENEKPPFNYAQIIAMAMMDKGKMTLKEICKYIEDHFAYFRQLDNWNNSIRHNLSLHFCFSKVARKKDEKGKGGYWELSMNTIKSERKRIRNRRKRSHQQQNGKSIQHHHRSPPAKFKKLTERTNNNNSSSIKENQQIMIVDSVNKLLDQHNQQQQQNENLKDNSQMISIANDDMQQDFDQLKLINDGSNEIFLGCDIPLSGDCVIIPYIQSTVNDGCNSGSGVNGLFCENGPNVIVEAMPYTLSEMDTVLNLEQEISSFVNLQNSELGDENFFDYTNW